MIAIATRELWHRRPAGEMMPAGAPWAAAPAAAPDHDRGPGRRPAARSRLHHGPTGRSSVEGRFAVGIAAQLVAVAAVHGDVGAPLPFAPRRAEPSNRSPRESRWRVRSRSAGAERTRRPPPGGSARVPRRGCRRQVRPQLGSGSPSTTARSSRARSGIDRYTDRREHLTGFTVRMSSAAVSPAWSARQGGRRSRLAPQWARLSASVRAHRSHPLGW